MSILTNIGGIPLFSTMQEALSWASANGLSGYHTHFHLIGGVNKYYQMGYMGGVNHSQAVANPVNLNPTPPPPPPSPTPPPPPPPTFNPSSGGGSGGSGGGY